MVRPAGSSSLQYRQRSPALATTARDPIGERESLIRDGVGDGAGRGTGAAAALDAVGAGGGTVTGAVANGVSAVARIASTARGVLSSSGPASSDRSAPGERATVDVANCLNAVGSGFLLASSERSRSRMVSSTIR